MKKKDIIAEIQKLEANYWLQLKRTEVSHGYGHKYTDSQRARWVALDSLMTTLGVQSDPSLPEQQLAAELVHAKYQKEYCNEAVEN